jgi:hypothetical protein
MIFGNGFLAKNLHYYGINSLPLVVQACGVSNSQCDSIQEFEREKNLITKNIKLSKKLNHPIIYFSSIVADIKSPYIEHKKGCEKMIKESGVQHCIIRCPQLIGYYLNNHQLVGHLYQQILKGQEFKVFTNSERNILDVECVANFIKLWCDNPKYSQINICYDLNIPVIEIVSLIERQINIKAKYIQVRSSLSNYDTSQQVSWKELEAFGVIKQVPYAELFAKYFYTK